MKKEDRNGKTGYIKCKPVSPLIGNNFILNLLLVYMVCFYLRFSCRNAEAKSINLCPFFAGSQRASFLVSGYGRSQMSKDVISVDCQDKLYLFQTHAGTRNKPFSKMLLPGAKEVKVHNKTEIHERCSHLQMFLMSVRPVAARQVEQFLQ